MALPSAKVPILSTAGAIPVRNEKGQVTMEKVKVQRYVSGKRPEYAPQDSSDEEEDIELPIGQKRPVSLPSVKTDAEKEDRRLRRLQERHAVAHDREEDEDDAEADRIMRHRRLHEPQVLATASSDEEEEEDEEEVGQAEVEESSEEEEELDEEEIERRRALLRQKARQQRQEEEVLDKEEEKSDEGSDEESSEYEEYTDSEEEETGPRLKPVFVRRKDRVTIQQKEREVQKQREMELESKRMAEERKRMTIKMVADDIRKEREAEAKGDEDPDLIPTDDDNDEEEYEAWKVRELKRMKRDKEEREAVDKEKMEIERLHNMTEEERRLEQKMNPKQITNKPQKGKYKFLQKYYHRGAFFMDKEEEVLKQDFASPTLEDHFDKTILPKVMQVKNFGRSGRTKYTHLVDQDTTQFDSPWTDNAMSQKFYNTKAGGMKQVFERPSKKRK